MRTLLALILAVLAAAPTQAQPASPAPTTGQISAADRGEIEALFARWETAWADGDAVARRRGGESEVSFGAARGPITAESGTFLSDCAAFDSGA